MIVIKIILILLITLYAALNSISLIESRKKLTKANLASMKLGYNDYEITRILNYNRTLYLINLIVILISSFYSCVIIGFNLFRMFQEVNNFITFVMISLPYNLIFFSRKFCINVKLDKSFGLVVQSEFKLISKFMLKTIIALCAFYGVFRLYLFNPKEYGGVFILMFLILGAKFLLKYSMGKPLTDDSLLKLFSNLASNYSLKFKGVKIRNLSKITNKGTAYFHGGNKKIYFDDTLFNVCDENELFAIFAHELGHIDKKHNKTGVLYIFLYSLISTTGFYFVFGTNIMSSSFGYAQTNYVILSFSVFLMFYLVKMIINVIENRNSIKKEFEADLFSVENSSYEKLASALRKVHYINLKNPIPHFLDVVLNYNHPPLIDRLEFIVVQQSKTLSESDKI